MSKKSVEFFLAGGSWASRYVVLVGFANVDPMYIVLVVLRRGLV